MLAQYSSLDILVFVLYGLLLLGSGWWINRAAVSSQDFFLAQKQMPMWLVAISILATSQSAATFLGGPDQGFRGNLTYLATNIGAFIAAVIVARWLIPLFYERQVSTVYQLLQQRFGETLKQRAGMVYLFGRLFASGARLYIAAIAVAMILFGDIAPSSVMSAITVIVVIGIAYSIVGGIRSVIYSDAIQCVVYISAAIAVVIVLINSIPTDLTSIYAALNEPMSNTSNVSKLTLFDWRLDFSGAGVFSMASIFTGFVLLNIAAFGLDQDLTQRALTCESATQSARAMLLSIVLLIPVMLLFLVIGLLLYVYYQRPDLMHSGSSGVTPEFAGQTVTVFMHYVLTTLPAGIKAWVTIGIVAAALSTLNSGLNAMASVIIDDLLKPRFQQHKLSDSRWLLLSRLAMLGVGIALGLMAALCFYLQQYSDMPLLSFALSVMVFSYSGLLGVFFVTLFTNRGNAKSMSLALIIGFIVPVLMQPYVFGLNIGFTWQLCIGTLASCLVAAWPKNHPTH
jgi:SSS family solute:Na+ symporter